MFGISGFDVVLTSAGRIWVSFGRAPRKFMGIGRLDVEYKWW